jgi:DNA recombination-dependent growth factor C
MAILSGAMSVRRFRVLGDVPEGFRELYRERLNEFAFRTPASGVGKDEIEGWVQVHNLLDAEFDDFNRWLYNEFALFGLRVDKKVLPARLFRATLEKQCEAWCQERDVERCPASVKSDIKDALEQEWLRRTLPRVGLTEACWNIVGGYLVLHGMSEAVTDRFRKRFHRTFGLKLVPWTPLDWLDAEGIEAMLATGPTLAVGEVL